jgi:hypothetical protein
MTSIHDESCEGRVLDGCDVVGQRVTGSKAWTIRSKEYLWVAEKAIAPQLAALQLIGLLTRVHGRCAITTVCMAPLRRVRIIYARMFLL